LPNVTLFLLTVAFILSILQQRKSIVQQKEDEEEEEESDLEFESDEDSDDDYEDTTLKPWQKKKAEKTSSRLDTYEEPAESSDEEVADVSGKERAPPVEAELEDYIKVTLPRRRLARWCNEPFFTRAVVGCYVRLFIGESEDGKKCYRLCEIIDVEKSKSEYKFPAPSSKEKAVRRMRLSHSDFPFAFLVSHVRCPRLDFHDKGAQVEVRKE
jgi:hypothetical protein